MKELIKGLIICVFMLNMAHVIEKGNEKERIKDDKRYAARRARMLEINRELAKADVERALRVEETERPVLAGY